MAERLLFLIHFVEDRMPAVLKAQESYDAARGAR